MTNVIIPAISSCWNDFYMEHHRSLDTARMNACWLAVGVFDGVHRGHQKIIQRLTTGAHSVDMPAVVLTFDPHPAKLFGRGEIKLLTLPDERAGLLGGMGVDVIVTHPFDRKVADTTAYDFMKLLKDRIGLHHLVLGYDSTLGKNREGNAARLAEIGSEVGYTLETVPALSDESGVISSTEIRKLVSTGNVREAARLMGHPYQLRGRVVRGDQRGRTIGFPTANLVFAFDKLIPAGGIYACWADTRDGKYRAAVNIGINPTFTPEKQTISVEAYLLDFEGDLYDQELRLEFILRLRDEMRYDSVEALVSQINEDVVRTRTILDESQP